MVRCFADTIKQDMQTRNSEPIDVFICPHLNVIDPKKFVPIKYPMESGIKTVPICHFYKVKNIVIFQVFKFSAKGNRCERHLLPN